MLKTKIVYAYHPETKNYIGETLADESPLEKDVFLIPANATTVPPPQVVADQVARFSGHGWIVENIDKPQTETPPEPNRERLLSEIRKLRNYLLYLTDSIEIPAIAERLGPEKTQEILDYRQALRDFPNTCDALNPVWPEMP